jgi:hypothetical protein
MNLLAGSFVQYFAQFGELKLGSVQPFLQSRLLALKPDHLQKPLVVHASSGPQQVLKPSLEAASQAT